MIERLSNICIKKTAAKKHMMNKDTYKQQEPKLKYISTKSNIDILLILLCTPLEARSAEALTIGSAGGALVFSQEFLV